MTNYKKIGGPCRRQCDVDKETLVCNSCGMYYGKVDKDE
tara:strand:- start:5980 stop:6096 length:117 start_codon:yes stop_codon:yes gene_type:complete